MSQQEPNFGTLNFPPGYTRELNQVAGVTTQDIIFLKRKFFSSDGWGLVKHPLGDCRLKFKMHDGKTLGWKSLAGERKSMSDSVNGIVEDPRSKGLLTP